MLTLTFDVNGQRIKRTDHNSIIAGSKGYLEAQFSFDSVWTGLKKAVSFFDVEGNEYAYLLKSSICEVPDEVTDGRLFKIQLTGANSQSKILTSKVTIRQVVG